MPKKRKSRSKSIFSPPSGKSENYRLHFFHLLPSFSLILNFLPPKANIKVDTQHFTVINIPYEKELKEGKNDSILSHMKKTFNFYSLSEFFSLARRDLWIRHSRHILDKSIERSWARERERNPFTSFHQLHPPTLSTEHERTFAFDSRRKKREKSYFFSNCLNCIECGREEEEERGERKKNFITVIINNR